MDALQIADRLETGERLTLSGGPPTGRGTLMQEVAAELSRRGHVLSTVYQSECGHSQYGPTPTEIASGSEIIGRSCPHCAAALWWNVDRWRR